MIQNATEVRLIIHLLKYLKNNSDLEAKANFLQYLAQNSQNQLPVHDFIAKGMEQKQEADFENWLMSFNVDLSFQNIRKKSLYEAVETIISKFLLSPAPSEGGGAKAENRVDKLGYMTGGNYSHLLIEKAKEMRKQPTHAEKVLWMELKSKSLEDYKFRQQHLIDDFIVDFVCLSKRLVIEVDGGIHDLQKEYDAQRTEILNKKGFKVIRFSNDEVIGSISVVLEKIKEELIHKKLF